MGIYADLPLCSGARRGWRNGIRRIVYVSLPIKPPPTPPHCHSMPLPALASYFLPPNSFPNPTDPAPQDEEKIRLKGEVHRLIAPRDQKHQSNFVEFRSLKIVYRRYAGLFFCVCVDANDNELSYLEAIHFFVEVLDSFFGNVCELDLVFNFYKVCGFWGRGDEVIWWSGSGERYGEWMADLCDGCIGLCDPR